jgi:hypothetical protein
MGRVQGLQSGTVRALPTKTPPKHCDSFEGRPRIQSSRSNNLGSREGIYFEHAIFFRIWECWIWQAGGDFWRNRLSPAHAVKGLLREPCEKIDLAESIASHVGNQVQMLCGLAGIPTKGGAKS